MERRGKGRNGGSVNQVKEYFSKAPGAMSMAEVQQEPWKKGYRRHWASCLEDSVDAPEKD